MVPNKTSENFDVLHWISIAGFVCNGLGIFFAHLFSASTQQMKELTATVQDNSRAIITGDKSQLVTPPVQTLGEAAAKVAAKQNETPPQQP